MPVPVVGRAAETRAVADFLEAATHTPSGLVVEGEPGIGKTTLWLATLEGARDRGFHVLSTRGAQADAVLGCSSLANLLQSVEPSAAATLPAPQRVALDRVLLRAAEEDAATDQRAVAAGFLSILGAVSEVAPTLVAIDDLQWLDPSSALVIAFAARRLSGRIGVLATMRIEPGHAAEAWLQLPDPAAIKRIRLSPFTFGDLYAMLTQRLDNAFSRSVMVRIHEISGGNPFYALELARTIDDDVTTESLSLPSTLTELVKARIGSLGGDVYDVLLAASCSAAPTIDVVAAAVGADPEHAVRLLEDAEAKGIIGVEGHRLRFAHPLLAWGVYTGAEPARRREIHRRLASIVDQPELAARHLALASTTADPQTLHALDTAAESARRRGAPMAAAELIELALQLGGDSAERRILLANHHFDAGNTSRARELLTETIDTLGPGTRRAKARHDLGVVHMGDQSFLQAADCFEHALGEVGDNLTLQVQILASLAWVQLQAGPLDEAVSRCEEAVALAERLDDPYMLSQVLSFRSVLYFIRGDGLDEASMRRALDLAEGDQYSLITINPRMQHALLLSWTGQLERAHKEMTAIKRDCVERGGESELIFVAFHRMLLEIWRGNFTTAALEAEDMAQRADYLAGNISRAIALAMRSAIAAYAGHIHEARGCANDGLAVGGKSGARLVVLWQLTILGFLEVSAGDYEAAIRAVGPLVPLLDSSPNGTEIVLGSYLPDVAEAFVETGRFDEAEAVIDALERNGRRLDRAWMLAVAGRCRGMLLAARGDLDAAIESVVAAMAEHDRLPMPFERARTQLLLGRLQRRGRQKDAASTTLSEALGTFEELGTSLWAGRAQAELARTHVAPRPESGLTQSERRVAELAASGMTNRAVAAELFVSPKTVEANLARVYRKLGIRSRAELGRRMAEQDP